MANNSFVSMMEVTNRTTALVYFHQDSTHYNSSLPWYSQPNADVQRIVAMVWFALCALIGVPPTILVIIIYVKQKKGLCSSNATVIVLLTFDVIIILLQTITAVGNIYQLYQTEMQCQWLNKPAFLINLIIQLIILQGISLNPYFYIIDTNCLTSLFIYLITFITSIVYVIAIFILFSNHYFSNLQPIAGNPGVYACTIIEGDIPRILLTILASLSISIYTGLNAASIRKIWRYKVDEMRDRSAKACIMLFWRDSRMLVVNNILVILTLVTWIPISLIFLEIIPDSPMYRYTFLMSNATHCYVFGICNPRIRKKIANLLGCAANKGQTSSTSTS